MAGFIRIAHRGASGSYPENTRLAFEKALEAGVDMIQMDCQLSKDGHVVVIHDGQLKRTGRAAGRVSGKRLGQLKKLDAGRWFKRSFKGQKILTLEEALGIVAGKADLVLEIGRAPRAPLGIELKILFILSHYDYLERAVVASADYGALRRLRELAPDAALGVLYGAGMKENPFQAARELRASSLLVQKELATRNFIERASQLGLKSFVWTVNDLREMERLLGLGADGLVSDFPEKFWKIKPKGK